MKSPAKPLYGFRDHSVILLIAGLSLATAIAALVLGIVGTVRSDGATSNVRALTATVASQQLEITQLQIALNASSASPMPSVALYINTADLDGISREPNAERSRLVH